MSGKKKFVIVLILILFLLTAGVYGYGVYFFTNHFLPGSMVNGFNCSYMTAAEAEDLLSRRVGAYVLALQTRNNGEESITAEQAGLVYTPDGSVQNLIEKQNRFRWFLSFGQHEEYQMAAGTSYDSDKLTQAVSALVCMQQQNVLRATDAFIKETDTGYEIVPEVEGNQLDPQKTIDMIAAAMTTMSTPLNLEEAGCYVTPAVRQDDEMLVKNCEQMNRLTSVVITYDFADRTETLDRNTIKNWLVRDGNGDYTLDRAQAAAYVNELGFRYDTFGRTRTFLTYDNREITIEGGDYGWAIDQEAETDALVSAIVNGETQVRQPIYAYEAKSRGENDIGYTYIEIDLTNQRLVLYKDGNPIVDTAVVTGVPDIQGLETPTGCYAVDAMQSPAVLTGEDYQSNVTFWMPFCGNVGIHDAPWRSTFGGQEYVFNGSHGCVNTPYEEAQRIYENIDVGTPVIVYK